MLLSLPHEFSPPPLTITTTRLNPNHHYMRSLSLLRTLSLSLRHKNILSSSTTTLLHHCSRTTTFSALSSSNSTFVEHLARASDTDEKWDLSEAGSNDGDGVFDFDAEAAGSVGDMKRFMSPVVEVKELAELPEQWRRTKIAWLCKELPAHKASTLTRILNAQRKWMRQEDATYLAVHCMRIRENETGFKVYKWMMQQHWYRFDFALATKLADYMGRERKFTKCREIYDDIINQGRVPSESTFHILIVAYLSAPISGCLDEACTIYNRMIQLGGYQPRLSLHNSLFRAIVGQPGQVAKNYLKQAEYIFHNLVTSGLEIHKDIYGGLIWLHSYQEPVDRERINELRKDMALAGIKEGKEVLVSVLRACAKEGDVERAEKIWPKFLSFEGGPPSAAFVYRMEVYSKIGKPMKSLEILREMQNHLGSINAAAYHKIIEVLCKFQEIEHAEYLMREFINSGLRPLIPSFIDLLTMYYNLSLHEKLGLTFSECLERGRPNRTAYNIYLGSLVKTGHLEKAEKIFKQMQSEGTIGVDVRACNTILIGYLASEDYVKAEKIYDFMCQKKYDIEAPLMEKLEHVLSSRRKEVRKPVSLKLTKEQREILVGLLLGGLQIESDERGKNYIIQFEFNENSEMHFVLKRHLYDQYHEWLHPSCKATDGSNDIPFRFSTVSSSYFGFYADQFWPKGQPTIPKLIHRWLSPRALAYWYMYGGHRTSTGDILLKLKGSREGIEKVVKTLKSKSLDCRVKRKGRIYWIGLLGDSSSWFLKLVEPYILDDLKDNLNEDGQALHYNDGETESINFNSGSDSDETATDYSDNDS